MRKPIWIAVLLLLSACTFFQEIYEPKDLLQVVLSYKDSYAPSVAESRFDDAGQRYYGE